MRRTDDMWAYDIDLWPWRSPRLSVILMGSLLLVLVILRLFVFDLWAIGPTWIRLITWPYDLDLWPWRSWRQCLMRVVILHPYIKFEVRRSCHSEDVVHDVCQHGPGDPNLWPFDLETGMRATSNVENLPSIFGHARPLGSRIICYVRDGRTDGQKQRVFPPSLWAGA